MNRQGHETADFFTGTEVEHTPAYGMTTLFVVGVQSVQKIQDWVSNFASYDDESKRIKHIYFGANHSFPLLGVNDYRWRDWEAMIQPFLESGIVCTLDVDAACAEGLCESCFAEYHNFIPMISVKLPYLTQLGYNATIKLDDKDFAATNPGVWCHSLHSLTDRSTFTSWDKYTKDQTI
jgi:hypothetical protein